MITIYVLASVIVFLILAMALARNSWVEVAPEDHGDNHGPVGHLPSLGISTSYRVRQQPGRGTS